MDYIEQQRLNQTQWQFRSDNYRNTIFDELLENEFIAPSSRQTNLDYRLASLVKYCSQTVPFYQQMFADKQMQAQDIAGLDDLPLLPVLERDHLQKDRDQLITTQLPSGQKFAGHTDTSGSTGQPVRVEHTVFSMSAFAFLKQREYRSLGFDPSQRFAAIRPASDLPKPNNQELEKQTTFTLPGWEYVGQFFKTADMVMLADTSGTDYMVDWLNKHKPAYLITMSAVLEQIALGYYDSDQASELTASLAVSQQMTKGMRDLIEQSLCTRVEQNYGLNEVGLIAMRCPESGYYHVHNENCLIEIVDDQGKACEPGVSGKLLVTGLANLAMPLIRYDTDDRAELPVDSCPCGRSLQSFCNLQGRYRRTAHLPEGTWEYWDTLLRVFSQAPESQMNSIKQYQLHQLNKNKFHLKLKVKKSLNSALKEKILDNWDKVNNSDPATLEIMELDEIEQQNKKFQNFISDIVPQE